MECLSIGIAELVKELYPGWVMRIHHDSSIDQGLKCRLECLNDTSGNLLDNVDFCDIEHVPGHQNALFKYSKWTEIVKGNSSELETSWNATYMNSMKWRWFPINDPFVEVFSSRDGDSVIIQRELDSVNVWLESDKVGHIMRGIF